MTELKPEARAALECLRRELGSDEERERVRNRLATLGLVTASAGAVSLASVAAASSVGASAAASSSVGAAASSVGAAASSVGASAAPPALAGVGAGAQAAGNLGAATGAALASASAGSAGSAGVALAAASVKAAGTTTLVSSLTAKLVALPVALKATVVGVVSVVAASSVTLPLTISSTSVQTTERDVSTPIERASHTKRPPTVLPHPHIVTPTLESAKRPDAPAQTLLLAPPPVQPPSASPVARTEALFPALSPARGGRPRKRSVASTSAPTMPPPLELNALADEGGLLERALRSLRAGELDETRSLLEEHERRHGPRAQLARERERIRAELTQRTR